MNPGEYPQPLARIGWHHFPVVPGKTTARWRNGAVGHRAPEAVKGTLVLQNVGDETVTLQVQETNNTSSGRANVGIAVTLVAGGFQQVEVVPTKPIIEIKCTDGNSQIRAQFESLLNWEVMPFDKNEAIYAGDVLIKGSLPVWSTDS